MKNVICSAADWMTPQDAHRALKEALGFPDYYGHNLDALHDCLTDLYDVQLIIEECAVAARNMPEKWPGFLAVFFDAASENEHLKIRLMPGSGDYI